MEILMLTGNQRDSIQHLITIGVLPNNSRFTRMKSNNWPMEGSRSWEAEIHRIQPLLWGHRQKRICSIRGWTFPAVSTKDSGSFPSRTRRQTHPRNKKSRIDQRRATKLKARRIYYKNRNNWKGRKFLKIKKRIRVRLRRWNPNTINPTKCSRRRWGIGNSKIRGAVAPERSWTPRPIRSRLNIWRSMRLLIFSRELILRTRCRLYLKPTKEPMFTISGKPTSNFNKMPWGRSTRRYNKMATTVMLPMTQLTPPSRELEISSTSKMAIPIWTKMRRFQSLVNLGGILARSQIISNSRICICLKTVNSSRNKDKCRNKAITKRTERASWVNRIRVRKAWMTLSLRVKAKWTRPLVRGLFPHSCILLSFPNLMPVFIFSLSTNSFSETTVKTPSCSPFHPQLANLSSVSLEIRAPWTSWHQVIILIWRKTTAARSLFSMLRKCLSKRAVTIWYLLRKISKDRAKIKKIMIHAWANSEPWTEITISLFFMMLVKTMTKRACNSKTSEKNTAPSFTGMSPAMWETSGKWLLSIRWYRVSESNLEMKIAKVLRTAAWQTTPNTKISIEHTKKGWVGNMTGLSRRALADMIQTIGKTNSFPHKMMLRWPPHLSIRKL